MSAAFLRQNQTPEERIKQQKREWYYRNRKSVLKQQKKSKDRKESKILNPFQLHMVGNVVGFPEFCSGRITMSIFLDCGFSLDGILYIPI